MGFIRKAFNFVVSPTHTRTVLVLFILAAAIPLTVFISQKQQQLKQRASGQTCEANYSSCTNAYNECSQSCSNLAQGDYDTYDAYTQAYYACTDKCSNDESICNTDAYNLYLQCLASADSNSASSVSLTPTTSQEPSATPSEPTPTLIPTTIPTILPTLTDIPTQVPTISIPTATPTSVIVQNSPTPTIPTPSPVPYCYLKNKGDADCDNKINIIDFNIWREEFLQELKGIQAKKKSDFNNDGKIDIVDSNIWKISFGNSSLSH